ncbi:hypothetical protein [Streptomyces sp. NPDC094031]|uniref:hypothetical protein n=1 Tax=Streptomyces sp. NPDC094031 TaxID=3155307 RepID=UPI003324DE45
MENLDAVRAGLGPRALLTVWPDLVPDVGAVLAALPEEGPVEFVREQRDGTISHAVVDDTEYQRPAAVGAGVCGGAVRCGIGHILGVVGPRLPVRFADVRVHGSRPGAGQSWIRCMPPRSPTPGPGSSTWR